MRGFGGEEVGGWQRRLIATDAVGRCSGAEEEGAVVGGIEGGSTGAPVGGRDGRC
eukprot:gene18763-2336_t